MYASTEYYQQEPSPTSVYIKTRGCVFVFLFRVCAAHKQHTRRTTRTLRTFCHKPAAAFIAHSTTATKDLGSQQREDKFVQNAGYSVTRVEPDRRRPFVNSFLMTLNLAQAVPGLCMNVLGARAGVFLEPLPADWRILRVTQVQTISLVCGEHQWLSQRTYVFGFTQTLVKRLLAVPSFSFCCCHTALFTYLVYACLLYTSDAADE